MERWCSIVRLVCVLVPRRSWLSRLDMIRLALGFMKGLGWIGRRGVGGLRSGRGRICKFIYYVGGLYSISKRIGLKLILEDVCLTRDVVDTTCVVRTNKYPFHGF